MSLSPLRVLRIQRLKVVLYLSSHYDCQLKLKAAPDQNNSPCSAFNGRNVCPQLYPSPPPFRPRFLVRLTCRINPIFKDGWRLNFRIDLRLLGLLKVSSTYYICNNSRTAPAGEFHKVYRPIDSFRGLVTRPV